MRCDICRRKYLTETCQFVPIRWVMLLVLLVGNFGLMEWSSKHSGMLNANTMVNSLHYHKVHSHPVDRFPTMTLMQFFQHALRSKQ